MPEIAYLYGIHVHIQYKDHPPPHVHLEYAGHWAKVSIRTGNLIVGWVPPSKLKASKKWIKKNQEKLLAAWNAAAKGQEPEYIESIGGHRG